MRLRRWVLTQRQKRFFRNAALVIFSLVFIGAWPPIFWFFLVALIAWGLWRFALRVRREKYGETRTRTI